jgi:hypothetical protein
MARPRKDGTAPKTAKTTKTAKAKAADVEKSVETVETPDAVAPVIESTVETVEEIKEPATTDVEAPVADVPDKADETAEDTPVADVPVEETTVEEITAEEITAEDAPAEEPAKDEKKDDAPKATKKKKVAINGIVQLNGATTIYRGPGVYPFAKINGVVSPLEDTDESGYTKVQCVISGSGACTGYVKL